MTRLKLVLILISALSLKAQNTSLVNTEALLWELQHDSLPGKTSYLFGTMHVQDKRAFQFPDSMMERMGKCQLFAGELDLTAIKKDAQNNKQEYADMLLLPPEISLKDLLMKSEYRKVKKRCRKQLGAMALLINKIKPVFTASMLTESVLKKEMKYPLDEYLQVEATKRGLEVTGLETADEQLEALSTMSYKDQAKVLLDEVEHFEETREAMNKMADWYSEGRLDSLYLATAEDSTMQGEFGDALLMNRNVVMTDRLLEIMKTKTVFCAIGAAHLPGDDGVLKLLQQKGYRIRPIRRK